MPALLLLQITICKPPRFARYSALNLDIPRELVFRQLVVLDGRCMKQVLDEVFDVAPYAQPHLAFSDPGPHTMHCCTRHFGAVRTVWSAFSTQCIVNL